MNSCNTDSWFSKLLLLLLHFVFLVHFDDQFFVHTRIAHILFYSIGTKPEQIVNN